MSETRAAGGGEAVTTSVTGDKRGHRVDNHVRNHGYGGELTWACAVACELFSVDLSIREMFSVDL